MINDLMNTQTSKKKISFTQVRYTGILFVKDNPVYYNGSSRSKHSNMN